MNDSYICPHCMDSMNNVEGSNICNKCDHDYNENIKKDSLDRDFNIYHNNISKSEINNLLFEIDMYGYENALTRFFKRFPKLRSYLVDDKKADGIYHGLGVQTRHCLDIGSGLGIMSEKLSYLYEYVYCMEIPKEFIEFQKRRYLNSRIQNIIIIKSDGLSLPFKNNFFDLIVCSNGFDWIESIYQNNISREIQIKFLNELKRVLNENGCIYFGFQNRLGFQILPGNINQNELPYTSSWSQQIIRLVTGKWGRLSKLHKKHLTKVKGKERARATTYTLHGYQNLLKIAGFTINSRWAFPTHNQPYYTGGTKNKGSIKGFSKFVRITYPKFISLKIQYKLIFALIDLMPSFLVGSITNIASPSFLFFCYKNKNNTSIEAMIKKETSQDNFITISDGSDLKYIVCDKDGNALKIVHLKRNISHIPNKLVYYNNSNLNNEIDIRKEMLWYSNWVPGKEIDPSSIDQVRAALNWLIDFQNQSRIQDMTEFLNEEIKSLLLDIDRIDEIHYGNCLTIINNYKSYILNHKLKVTKEHGDFWYGNILINKKHITVIDWDFYREKGDAFFDFTHFIINIYLFYGIPIKDLLKNDSTIPGLDDLKHIMRSHFNFEPDMKIILPYTLLRFSIRKRLQSGSHNVDWMKYSELIEIVK